MMFSEDGAYLPQKHCVFRFFFGILERRHSMSKLTYEMRSITEIAPYANNARKHSPGQIKQLIASMDECGFITPIVLDRNDQIIAGHARLAAATEAGFHEVPCLHAEHLTDEQVRAYRLADNKIAENATWDNELLRVELEFLTHTEIDISATGFSIAETDILIGNADLASEPEVLDADLLQPSSAPVTQSGEIWLVGPHRVGCGDVRDQTFLGNIMDGQRADMVFTDPPYNVKAKDIGGLGKVQHTNFVMASGEMSNTAFSTFLNESLSAMRDISTASSLHYICMDWRHLDALLLEGKDVYTKLQNLCVWVKTNAGMGSLYRSQHEFVAIFKSGDKPHCNNIQLGKDGRYRTNVWEYAGVNTFSKDRDEQLAMHPTVKPQQLVADAILDVTQPGDLVFDGFLGSGTTLLAARQVGRRCFATEIDPRYVDVALQRWIEATGAQPTLLNTNETYEQRAELKEAS